MAETLDRLLEQRRSRRGTGRLVASLAVAVALHGGAAAAALLGPRLFHEPPRQLEYVAVQLLPAPALGVERPAPPAPRPRPPEPRPVETAPRPPEPQAPVMPSPERRPEPKRPEPAPERRPEPESRPGPPSVASGPDAAQPPPDAGSRPGAQGSPTGSPTSAFTHGAAVAGVDNPDFVYGYYLDRMAALIRGQWARPALGSGIEAMIHFRIDSDGSVSEVRVIQSSGYSSFDLAALRAVHAAAPLPPLPRSYRERSLGVNLIFR